ncbi:hypothetical protein [Psychrilyobacter sp.]|uniref:hypothetical protein n=1 Tax=Psychrilyobacter sp. TaxID=2586924 RepID=UPI003018E140
MWGDISVRLWQHMNEYYMKFEKQIPLMSIPDSMPEDELINKIELAIKEGKTIEHYISEIDEDL